MDFSTYIEPSMLVLIPVLYLLGMGIKKTEKIKDKYIPCILGAVGVILSTIITFSVANSVSTVPDIFSALITGIVQGILVAGASVYGNQIIKQLKK